MFELKNNDMQIEPEHDCGFFDANCIFCDGQAWDFNKS